MGIEEGLKGVGESGLAASEKPQQGRTVRIRMGTLECRDLIIVALELPRTA